MRTLLLVTEIRMSDEGGTITEALSGGGEYICERLKFEPTMAALIETAAVQAVVCAAGLGTVSLLDPTVPRLLHSLSALPLDRQLAFLRQAASSLDDDPPPARLQAALARSTLHGPAAFTPAGPAHAPTSAPAYRMSPPGR
ncbi:hypothetical protein KNE206_53210 [Kitasatospora sp. NE20-6]|uniref:hypothetical protein n=1 Tax=Kitasatospora sp. NE20-6 TaxID=2859066 RepID=UPI0034DC0419